MNSYYTEKEKTFVLKAYRDLRRALGADISSIEIDHIKSLIYKGIETGLFHRDKYGINPTVRHLNTALLLSKYVAADKNMIIATLIYHLCNTVAL